LSHPRDGLPSEQQELAGFYRPCGQQHRSAVGEPTWCPAQGLGFGPWGWPDWALPHPGI